MPSPFAPNTTTLPGSFALMERAFRNLLRLVVALVKAVVNRREVTRMLELDDRALKDIGLVRSDVLGALAEPLTRDPSILPSTPLGRQPRSTARAAGFSSAHDPALARQLRASAQRGSAGACVPPIIA